MNNCWNDVVLMTCWAQNKLNFVGWKSYPFPSQPCTFCPNHSKFHILFCFSCACLARPSSQSRKPLSGTLFQCICVFRYSFVCLIRRTPCQHSMTLQSQPTTLISLFSSSEHIWYAGRLLDWKNCLDLCYRWELNPRLPMWMVNILSTRPSLPQKIVICNDILLELPCQQRYFNPMMMSGLFYPALWMGQIQSNGV